MNQENITQKDNLRSFSNANFDRGIDAVDETRQVGSYTYYESGDGAPVHAVSVSVYAVAASEPVCPY